MKQYGDVINQDGLNVKLRVPKSSTPQITARILAEQRVDDLSVEAPPIEDVIEKIFDLNSAEGDAS